MEGYGFGLVGLLIGIALWVGAAGCVVGLIVWNVRRASGPSVALAHLLGGIGIVLGLETAPRVPGLVCLAIAVATITAACLGLTRRWPRRWVTRMLWAGSLALSVLWAATSAAVFWPRPPRFVEPLAGTPEGCPHFDFDAETPVRSIDADAPFDAELGPHGIRLHDERGRSLELSRPTAIRPPQYRVCQGPRPVLVGRRGEDEYCVGYDPEDCECIAPHVMFVDRALRPWPSGALSRLEARCGSLIRHGFVLAGLATLALALIGLLARRRWTGLLASSDPSAGRWRGLAQETEDGWTLMTDGEARPLDLRKARILGGKLAPGECRLVGSAQPAGDPYRGAHALVVARIASGDERSIAETIRLERARAWAIILATMTVVAVPVLLAVLASY